MVLFDAIFEFMYDETTNLDIKFNIYLNEISVVAFIIGNAGSAGTGFTAFRRKINYSA